jgi:hypothetical protein
VIRGFVELPDDGVSRQFTAETSDRWRADAPAEVFDPAQNQVFFLFRPTDIDMPTIDL